MKRLLLLISTVWLLTGVSPAQTPAAPAPATAAPATAAPAQPATPVKPVPVPITDQDLKSVDVPKPEVRAKGDPDGGLTGTVSDIAVSDAEKGTDDRRCPESGRPEQDRDQLHLDADHRLPRHVHAGGLRHRRNRTVPRQERQPHHDDELHGVRRRHARLLADRICDSDGRRRRRRQPRRNAAV